MLSNKTLIILTTILSVLILVTVFFNSCLPAFADEDYRKTEDSTYGYHYIDNTHKYRKVHIEDHDYFIFKTDRGQMCVIHSESCPCKKKK